MSKQATKGTGPELALRRELHRRGFRFRVQYRPLPGVRVTADIAFTRARVAVFVDGCFWHRCPEHGTEPRANATWWGDKLDANVCAYVAAGVWHRWLLTDDRGFVEELWPVVEKAIDFVLDLQTPRGEILWARHADGTPWSFALLTGSSSICHSLRCAIAIAQLLGHERPDWEMSAAQLAHVIREVPEAFAPKHRWAMDWYYPVLTGVVTGAAGAARLSERTSTFIMEGLGVRCVADRPWTTAAETCEAAMAYLVVGDDRTALDLFTWAQAHREDDGAYVTGIVHPEKISFPDGERTSYTAASVVLAATTALVMLVVERLRVPSVGAF